MKKNIANMDRNKASNFNLISFLIILLLMASSMANPNRRNDENGDFQKQYRLFSKHERDHWPVPQEQSEGLPEFLTQDKSDIDQMKNMFMKEFPPNLSPLFEMNEFKKHKLPPNQDPNYDDDYSWDRDLDPTLPYGIQNVIPDNVRSPRAKTRITRIKFQSLCPSKRETIFLNLDTDYEYRPDHYEEVNCANPFIPHHDKPHSKNVAPVCGEAGFSCIQLNRTIFLTRRAYGADCWESETRLVPAGCECMWPKHYFGDISAHH